MMEDAVLDVFSRLGSLGRPLRRACGWLGKQTEVEGTAGATAGVACAAVLRRWRELAGLNPREQEQALGGKGKSGDREPVLQSL